MDVILMMFMGQSNMAGRGNAKEAPALTKGAGYEYRAVTAPDCLSVLREPFGVDENKEGGVWEPGMKTGSMVLAFVNACYEQTQIPIVGISCAKGGFSIAEWMPGTPYYMDAVERMKRGGKWLTSHNYRIRYRGMVWCQGCTDGDLGTSPDVYKARTSEFVKSYCRECEVETCFLIQIGNHREDEMRYARIQQAQVELADENEKIYFVSGQFQSFAKRGLMKDAFHYRQEAYNLVGEEAGRNAGEYIRAWLDR